MKKIIIQLLALFWTIAVFGQTDAIKKDSVKVTFEYKQEIKNGKQTPKNWVISQKVKDMNDNLLREYFFNDSTHQLDSYVWYFYKNSQLNTKECYFSSDSLKCLTKFTYDNFGNKTEEAVFRNAGNSIVEYQKNIYNYSDGKKLSCKQYNKDNKVKASARYYYNLQGKLIKEMYKFKSRSGSKLKSEIITYDYKDDRVSQKIDQKKFRNGDEKEIYGNYTYNELGQLIELKETDKNSKPLDQMKYKYYPHGNLNIFWEYDGEGKLIKLLSYKYEIHTITPGTFKSYLDKLQKNN